MTPLIDSVAEDLRADPLIFKHSPVPDKLLAKFRQITEDDDPIEHLRRARLAVHPSNVAWDMEGSLAFAVSKISNLRESTVEWRRRMLQEVDDLKISLETEILDWRESVPSYVKKAYLDSNFCVPLFINLLQKLK
jgi:hypothetical protein